jgi:hypothetical protein
MRKAGFGDGFREGTVSATIVSRVLTVSSSRNRGAECDPDVGKVEESS